MNKLKVYLVIAILIAGLAVSNYYLIRTLRSYQSLRINFNDQVTMIDSLTYKNQVSEVNLQIWKQMNDSSSLVIKDLQHKLGVRDKELRSAGRVIASLRDSNALLRNTMVADTIVRDSIIYVHVDSLHYSYSDKWTNIEVYGDLDSLNYSYSTSTNLDVIQYIGYKPASTKFGRWWNRLWKRGKHESVTIESENPNLVIDKVHWVKINK